jgi:hypothetical protein
MRELGYAHVWLSVQDTADSSVLRILDVHSERRDRIFEHAATVPIAGDAMISGCGRCVVDSSDPDAHPGELARIGRGCATLSTWRTSPHPLSSAAARGRRTRPMRTGPPPRRSSPPR